jgi:hypothetical protein
VAAAYSSGDSATQCAQVSTRPDAEIQIAVPASCWAKTKVARAAAARFFDLLTSFVIELPAWDGDEKSLSRFELRVASSFLESPVVVDVSMVGKISVGIGYCCFS